MRDEAYEKILDQIEHYNRIDSHENTRRACLEALGHNPHDQWVLSMLTRAYYELGDYERCLKTGNEALANQTPYEQAFIYYLFGTERNVAEDHKKSAEYYKKAMERRPENADYIARYALELAHLGELPEARSLFERAEEMDPKNYFVLYSKFAFYREYETDRQAEEELLSRMVPLSTKPFHLNWNFGEFHYKYGEYQEAHDYFVQALLARPGNKDCKRILKQLEWQGFGLEGKRKKWRRRVQGVILTIALAALVIFKMGW